MLHSLNKLRHFSVVAKDGEIGFCRDFLFNDEEWNLHYMLIDTHNWLPGGKKALLHTSTIAKVLADKKEIHLTLDKESIKASPSLLSNDPISRAYQKTYMCYFDYATWKVGPEPFDTYIMGVHPERVKLVSAPDEPSSEKNHVHSANFIEDYDLQSTDDTHGHIKDFVVDDASWNIAFLAVEMGGWLVHDNPVLIPPSDSETINWPQQKIFVDLSENQIDSYPIYQVEKLAEI